MLRKKRQPGPHLKMPGAPYAPIKGEDSPLGRHAQKGTTLAFFQVIGDDPTDPATQDTHPNYIVCRGHEVENDPTFTFLYDPYTNQSPDAKAIHVAKPYGLRGTYPYLRGQVVVAARILSRIGYTAGKAATTVGHPADLDEEIEVLLDDEGVAISWLDLTNPAPRVVYGLAISEMAELTGTGDVEVYLPDFSAPTGEILEGCLNTWGLVIEQNARCRVEIIGEYKIAEPMECPTVV